MQIIHHDEYQYCGYNSLQAAVRLLREDKKGSATYGTWEQVLRR
ncbi:hypothetical protein [Chitinophaga polysaccharea]|nr:hypothetical protein [Chitinophaga polysaccharea]